MNHRVRHMKGKIFLKKTLGLRLQGAVRKQSGNDSGEPPSETCLGNFLLFPTCLKTLSEKKESCLFQLFIASPESYFHHVYSHCFVSSREATVREKEDRALGSQNASVSAGNHWSLREVAAGPKCGL